MIYLEMINPGGNAEGNRCALNVHSLGNVGAGGQLQFLVLMGSWVNSTDHGVMVMEQHVMVSQGTALLLCEREELTAGHHVPWPSSRAQPLGDVDGDHVGAQGCGFVITKTRTGLPLNPCSPAQPVGAQ